MYCKNCGHPLNEYGICPVCNQTYNTYQGNQYQNNNQYQANQYQNYNQYQANQYQNYNQYQANQYQNYNQYQANQYQNYNQYQSSQYQNNSPYNNAASVPNKPASKQKKKWPLITGISCGVAVIIAIIVVIIVKNNDVKDYTTDDTTEMASDSSTEESTTETPVASTGSKKTIMMYIVGSNLESEYGAATDDINEILSADLDEETNYLIYTGGSNGWYDSDIPDDANATFLVQDGELVEVSSEDARNMGEPDTLSDFMTYSYENYPADEYGLILWNHGGGAFSGYGYDELTDDYLTLEELSEAFDSSPFNEDNKLEWVGFDACLMANIETAHILSPYSNYLIASQESEPSWGWDYSFLSDISDMSDGSEIGTEIADHYISETESNFSSTPFSYCDITMSVLDLTKISDVENALNDLFLKANTSLNNETYVKYSRIRSTTKELASEFTSEYSYDTVDLLDLSQNMKTEFLPEATALEEAVSSFIVYNTTNEDNANGVSIYYPYNAKQSSGYYIPMYYGFNFATDYADYISNFATLLCGETTLTAEWDPNTLIPTVNGDMTFGLQLTDAQAASCQNAYYVISRADTDQPGNFVFVAMSNDTTLSDTNTLTANFNGNIIYIQNDTTLDTYELMYTEQEATDTYTRYLLSSILYNDDIEGDDAEYVYFVMETSAEHPQGQILGAYPIENYITSNGNEIFPDRYEVDISQYQNIAFGSASHQFTAEEDLTNFDEADWNDVSIWYNDFPISDGFSTVIGDMIPGIPYYGMFIIEDAQGNRHCSNLVQLQ